LIAMLGRSERQRPHDLAKGLFCTIYDHIDLLASFKIWQGTVGAVLLR
jgi:hypothetical protein